MGEIENKDQLSPTEVEIRTEFGKNLVLNQNVSKYVCVIYSYVSS